MTDRDRICNEPGEAIIINRVCEHLENNTGIQPFTDV